MRRIILDFGTADILGRTIQLRLPGYGLMVAAGFLLAILLARWRARRCGESRDVLTNCGILALIGGVGGARLAYVVQHWEDFAHRPGGILNFTGGGLIYYGGVGLATILVLIYLRVGKLPIRRYLDILAVSLMVGLAFGRAGCLLNGCCPGGPAREDSALAMRFPMYSSPLVKLGGDENPFWEGATGPGPVYSEQFDREQVTPHPRLLNSFTPRILPPRDLHGPLESDQLEVMYAEPSEARGLFARDAGGELLIGREDWHRLRRSGDGFLRGSEHWEEAIVFDVNGDGKLSFQEAWEYLQQRRELLEDRFGDDREAANDWLSKDLYSLAAAERSAPVKPAQPLGLVNALLLAALLAVFFRLRRWEGQVFALLVIAYPITRFVLESIRSDNPHALWRGVLTHNQYTSIAMAAVGIVLYLCWRRLPASAGPVLAERTRAAPRTAPGDKRQKR